jgi:hypothetical protein
MTRIVMIHSNGKVLRLSSGFNLLGFLIPQLWSMMNAQWRLWAMSLVPVLIIRLAGGLQDFCDKTGKSMAHSCELPTDSLALCALLLQILVMGICGFRGNSILMKDALKRGYTNVQTASQSPDLKMR